MAGLDRHTASTDALHPNTWNPNKMNERQYEAEKESITAFGFIDPVTVRPHPQLPDAFEIIDGEHRVRAARDLGLKTLPTVVLDVDDATAKKLTIVLNETRGKSDPVDLSQLLTELAQGSTLDELLLALPYTSTELDNLLALADWDWDAATEADDPDTLEGDGLKGHRLVLTLTDDQLATLESAKNTLAEAGLAPKGTDALAWATTITNLARSYLNTL